MTDSLPGTPPPTPPTPPQPPSSSSEEPFGALQALARGWEILLGDFVNLWLAGLLFVVVGIGVGLLGAIPCIGAFFSIASTLFVTPQLYTGLLHVALRRTDGASVQPLDLFEGFRSKFVQSLVAFLPLWGIILIVTVPLFLLIIGGMSLSTDAAPNEDVVAILVFLLFMSPAYLFLAVVCLFFIFVPAVIWDLGVSSPALEPVKRSFRLVRDHIWTMLLLGILIVAILTAAWIVGTLLLCVGVFVTVPAATLWCALAVAVLYRQWTRESDVGAGN